MDKKPFGNFAASFLGLAASIKLLFLDGAFPFVSTIIKVLGAVILVYLSHIATQLARDNYSYIKARRRKCKQLKNAKPRHDKTARM